jgi:hypothetical protein
VAGNPRGVACLLASCCVGVVTVHRILKARVLVSGARR